MKSPHSAALEVRKANPQKVYIVPQYVIEILEKQLFQFLPFNYLQLPLKCIE